MRTPDWFLKRTLVAYLLLPAAALYYLFSKMVYFYRLIHQKSSQRPVICIGNIFAGGVGKTPIVMQIAKYLGAPVVMRGYKKGAGTQGHRGARWRGDEAEMLANAGIDVYVGNRVKNIKKLNLVPCALAPLCPIVMDDGFQNPTVKKNLSILVFDESLEFGNGFVLPAGPLREPPCATKRGDAVIVIRRKAQGARRKVFIDMISKYGKPVFYADNKNIMPKLSRPVIAFAGIGYPQKFFNNLTGDIIKTISFPDHHQYTDADLDKLFALAKLKNAQLLTTEKDWVRLPKSAQVQIKYVPLETTIEPKFWEWLNENIKKSN